MFNFNTNWSILIGPCSNNYSGYIGKLEISKIKKPSCFVKLIIIIVAFFLGFTKGSLGLSLGNIYLFSHFHNFLTLAERLSWISIQNEDRSVHFQSEEFTCCWFSIHYKPKWISKCRLEQLFSLISIMFCGYTTIKFVSISHCPLGTLAESQKSRINYSLDQK